MSINHTKVAASNQLLNTQKFAGPTSKSKLRGKCKSPSSVRYASVGHDKDMTRSLSNKTSKIAEGGKQVLSQKNGNIAKSSHTSSSMGENQIKVPKAKTNRKPPLSRVKKSEMEKQTLLVMDQMISHVKDFTTKERYFDYKKIASNIKAYSLTSTECKKLWEQFKARLRGQFKEGNEEMRQCRNECNEDFWTHHNNMFPSRLKIYQDTTKADQNVEELSQISNRFSDKNKALYYDSLLEVNENESKLLPIMDDYKHLMKAGDDIQELEKFEDVLDKISNELESKTKDPTVSMKDKHKCQDEIKVFDKLFSQVYSDMSSEYQKRVYNPKATSNQLLESNPYKQDIEDILSMKKSDPNQLQK